MALEAVKKVKEIEKQTEELLAQAEKEAARMLQDAKVEGEKAYDEIVSNAKAQGKEIMSDALTIVEREVGKIVAQGKLQQEEIVQHSEERLSDAINLVIERIVDMNGNS